MGKAGRRLAPLVCLTLTLGFVCCGTKPSSSPPPPAAAQGRRCRPLLNLKNHLMRSRADVGGRSPDRLQTNRQSPLRGGFHSVREATQLVQNDIEVVGGMAGADGMCRPIQYNVFVFVGRTVCGFCVTGDDDLAARRRIRNDDADGAETLTTEFLRYTDADPLCCPSSRVSAQYRIHRSGQTPLLVPLRASPVR
jgi:hypothetical protein